LLAEVEAVRVALVPVVTATPYQEKLLVEIRPLKHL
jgi:hypothetical protein